MKIYTRVSFTILFCSILSVSLFAQAVKNTGNVNSVQINNQQIFLKTDNANISLTVYSPSVFRIRMDKKELNPDFSYAVISKPEKVKVTIAQTDNAVTVSTDSLKAVITKKPYAITFYTPSGKIINEDEKGLTTSWVGENVTTYKKMQPDEKFIGLGEKTGDLNRAGNGYTNWNSDVYGYSTSQDPLYSTIPFYIGIHNDVNYGIFLDNTYQSDFNFGASNNRFSSFEARGGEMNYYFIYHKNIADIITSYTALTGRMEMPPLWSLGYQQNRYSYYPETEVMRIAQTLREKKLPCDGITLDIHYMDNYQLFTWNKSRFPDPPGMAAKLKGMGLRLTVIVDPGIKVQQGAPVFERGLRDSVYLKYADGQNYTGQVWPGWCNFTDFTSEKGRAFWRREVKFFPDNGVSGIWNDMNEISTWGQKMPDNVIFDYDGHKVALPGARNVYGMQMARSSFEGMKQVSGERPFILTRSGYAGIQRYAAMWTGDNRAEDNHMILGIRLMNSLGLSGVAFTGMDIGGFTGNGSVPLFTRWMEIGAFIPYYRNHTGVNTKSAEPWTFGEEALEISRNYINLRYHLLPYIYSTFYEATQNGLPVMRTLAINYTFDQHVYNPEFQNQYLFGHALMIAPFESGKEYGNIYWPKGTWYNLYTDEVTNGGQSKVTQLSVQKLPVYVKGGSIIPMQSLIQSTAEKPTDTLNVHVYKGTEPNTFIYYEDDGKTYNYQKGNFYKRKLVYDPLKKAITFNAAEGDFKSKFKQIKVVFHGFGTGRVDMNGKRANLQSETISLLQPITKFDPQGGAAGVDGVNVKTLTVNNSNNKIVFNYQ